MENYIKQKIRELAAENFNWWAAYIRAEINKICKD